MGEQSDQSFWARAYQRLWEAVAGHRRLVIGLSALLALLSVLGISRISYNHDLDVMLPADELVQRTMHFLRTANFSHDVILSLRLNDERHTPEDLQATTEGLLASISSPLVTPEFDTAAGGEVMQDILGFMQYAPQVQSAAGFAQMEKSLAPAEVKERLRGVYFQTLTPGSSFTMPFLRTDPLGLSGEVQRNFTQLSATLGSQMVLHNGYLTTRDGRHAMIILKTPVMITDSFHSGELLTYLRARLATLPGWVAGGIVAGHTHAVSNEQAIKHDIGLTTFVGGVGFLLLFCFSFRTLRASLIFLLPPVAVLLATDLSFLVFRNLSSFVVGLSTVIAGIAIDYGIYVFVAVQRAGNSLATLRQIIRPVTFGALTTVSVFAAFFVSRVEGYRQLALVSNLSILICLGVALFILPHFVGGRRAEPADPDEQARPPERRRRFSDNFRLALGGALLLACVALGPRLVFDTDITQYDATEPGILAAEAEFHQAWGGSTTPAILVVSGPTLGEAMRMNDAIYDQATNAVGGENFSSLAPLWPSRERRQANLQRWENFWTAEREGQLRAVLAEQGQTYGFSTNAFQPFFERLHPRVGLTDWPEDLPFFDQLKRRFVLEKDGRHQLLSFVPNNDEFVARLQPLTKQYPQLLLISQKHFSQTVSRAAITELLHISWVGILATILLTWWLLKSLRLMLLALLPVFMSLMAILGVLSALGHALSITCIIAALVVIGIVSDYGMFVVYYCQKQTRTGTYTAVAFAAISTLIGAGALLCARHPMLFSVGLVMVTGVLSGWVCSWLVIPPLFRKLHGPSSADAS